MPLADRLNEAPARMTGKPCSIGLLLDTLEGDELAALNAMLYELGWSQSRIVAALDAEGHSVGAQTPNRHRSRSCRCFRPAA